MGQLLPSRCVVVAAAGFFLTLLVGANVASASTVCSLPAPIEGTSYFAEAVKDNYTTGEVVVHFCSEAVGYGNVVQRCEANGKWSAPNRLCSDPPPIGGGTAVGFSFATFNMLFVFTVLVRNYFTSSSYEEDGATPSTDRPV